MTCRLHFVQHAQWHVNEGISEMTRQPEDPRGPGVSRELVSGRGSAAELQHYCCSDPDPLLVSRAESSTPEKGARVVC